MIFRVAALADEPVTKGRKPTKKNEEVEVPKAPAKRGKAKKSDETDQKDTSPDDKKVPD